VVVSCGLRICTGIGALFQGLTWVGDEAGGIRHGLRVFLDMEMVLSEDLCRWGGSWEIKTNKSNFPL